MPVKMKMTVTGDAPQALKDLAARTRDMRPAWAQVGAYMLGSVEKNFRAGGRPTPWKPSKKKSGMTLIDTAGLKNSISYQVLASGQGVEVGTNKIYGRIHQLGGQAGRGHKVNIPARPYLVVQPEDDRPIRDILAGHVLGPLAKGPQ